MVLTHVVEHLGSKKADLNKGKMKQIGEDDEEEEKDDEILSKWLGMLMIWAKKKVMLVTAKTGKGGIKGSQPAGKEV